LFYKGVDTDDVSLPPSGYWRYIMCFMLFLVAATLYADRSNIGLIIQDFGYSDVENGFILSAFFLGYMVWQIPSAILADRFGGKVVIIVGVLITTLFDLLTVYTYKSLPILILSRIGVGCGESVLFPVNHYFATNWYPKSEKSTLVAFMVSGIDFGTIIALLISPIIADEFDWPWVLFLFGFLAIGWAAAFSVAGASRPEEHRFMSKEEIAYIVENRPHSKRRTRIKWSSIIRSKAFYAVLIHHFTNNWGAYVLLSWLGTYFEEELGVDLSQSSILAAAPYIVGLLLIWVGGRLSDWVVARYAVRPLRMRQAFAAIASFIPMLGLWCIPWVVSGGISASLVLCIAVGASRTSANSYIVNIVDIAPNHASEVMGVSNTVATIPGILGNIVTGVMLEATGWSAVFYLTGAIFGIGGLSFILLADDQPIPDQDWEEDPLDVEPLRPEEVVNEGNTL